MTRQIRQRTLVYKFFVITLVFLLFGNAPIRINAETPQENGITDTGSETEQTDSEVTQEQSAEKTADQSSTDEGSALRSAADGSYPVTITLYDPTYDQNDSSDQSNKIQRASGNFVDESGLATDSSGNPIKFAVRGTIKDENGQPIGYACVELDQSGLQSSGQAKVNLNFKTEKSGGGNDISFDPSANQSIELRLLHQINPYYCPEIKWDLWTPGNNVSEAAPSGYAFVGSGGNAEGGYINLRASKPVVYHIRLQLDEDGLKVAEEDNLYVLTTIEHTSGTANTYSLVNVANGVKATDSNGNTVIDFTVTQWYSDTAGTTTINTKFTGNEERVSSRFIVKDKNGTWQYLNSDQSAPVLSLVNEYEVIQWPVTEKGAENNTRLKVENDTVTDVYDVFKLSKISDDSFQYTLEYILNGFNYVTLCDPSNELERTYNGITYHDGNLVTNIHTLGGILVRGSLSGAEPKFADQWEDRGGYDLTKPSYIGGTAPTSSGAGGGPDGGTNPVPNFYLGASNTVYGNVVNGTYVSNDGYNRHGKTFIYPEYIDWDRLQTNVISVSTALGKQKGLILK